IEESEELQCQAATDTAQWLAGALPTLRIGLVHGRMKSMEKELVMNAFRHGEIDLLVATTVIEVGVDVPRATLMVIENAERLGLAQLHQLRGRVGRGTSMSACVLMYRSPLSVLAKQRLGVMRDTNDGFEIARQDMAIRGPGEVLGTRQSGEMRFRIADIVRDQAHIAEVDRVAQWLLTHHPDNVEPLISRWVGSAGGYGSV
ncbi:MAG: ATP-dependent DNA helicase RecG, partial [Halothiobacillaceae bacterium]